MWDRISTLTELTALSFRLKLKDFRLLKKKKWENGILDRENGIYKISVLGKNLTGQIIERPLLVIELSDEPNEVQEGNRIS